MSLPFSLPLQPSRDKKTLRRQLQAERQSLVDRHQRSVHLQEVLRVWLIGRTENTIGAYWPIKGEFDALPALYRWSEAEPDRRIGLPVMDRETKQLRFHVWYPGCPMEEDAYGIPKPKDTDQFEPGLLLVPCVGFGPGGVRRAPGRVPAARPGRRAHRRLARRFEQLDLRRRPAFDDPFAAAGQFVAFAGVQPDVFAVGARTAARQPDPAFGDHQPARRAGRLDAHCRGRTDGPFPGRALMRIAHGGLRHFRLHDRLLGRYSRQRTGPGPIKNLCRIDNPRA